MSDTRSLIQLLNLGRHPEGGWYKQNYKAKDIVVTPKRYNSEERASSTSIYYLLEKEDFSAWHRLKSDEIWHYYYGCHTIIHIINNDGKLQDYLLGNPVHDENASFQVIIPANQWFSAELNDKKSFCLIGCTVSPGFEFKDFELANRSKLISNYPNYEAIITKLTRENNLEEKVSENTNSRCSIL